MSERRPRRFFSNTPLNHPSGRVTLSIQETHHLQKIIRLHEGDLCLITDGLGQEAEAVVVAFSSVGAVLEVRKVFRAEKEQNSLRLFVYPAVIQKGKMDDLLRQLQELAVDGVVPIETSRAVIKMKSDAKMRVLERWQKISQEAAKQSGALFQMQISEPLKLSEVFKKIPEQEPKVMFHPDSSALCFKDWTQSIQMPARVHLFFGPEGGFSDQECEFLKKCGVQKVSLGKTILKADTAVLSVAAALRLLFL